MAGGVGGEARLGCKDSSVGIKCGNDMATAISYFPVHLNCFPFSSPARLDRTSRRWANCPSPHCFPLPLTCQIGGSVGVK